MRHKIKRLTILLSCLLIFLIASGGLADTAEKKQMTMQEMIQRFEEMEKRLSVLEDMEAIKRLQTEYVNMLQSGNYDNVGDLFTEDAVFEAAGPTITGKDKILKLYKENISINHNGEEGDILVQPIIDLDGDKAKGKWSIYFFYYHPKTYQTMWFVQSWFDMDYKKVDGEWKISRFGIIHHIEPPGGPPNEERFLNFLDDAQKTMQEMND